MQDKSEVNGFTQRFLESLYNIYLLYITRIPVVAGHGD